VWLIDRSMPGKIVKLLVAEALISAPGLLLVMSHEKKEIKRPKRRCCRKLGLVRPQASQAICATDNINVS